MNKIKTSYFSCGGKSNLDYISNPNLTAASANRKWVKYNVDNLLPQNLIDLFLTSPTHSSIVRKKAEYTTGKRIYCTNPLAEEFAKTIDNGGGLYKLFYKTALDYYIHGGFSLQLLWNVGLNKPVKVEYQDWSTLRVGFSENKKLDENGVPCVDIYGNDVYEEGLYYSANWAYNPSGSGSVKFAPKYFPYFNPNQLSLVPTFYTYKIYTPGFDYYPLPDWYSCIRSILTEVKLIRFKDSTISNAFSPGGTLILPGTMDETAADEFRTLMETEYKGMENAGKTMIVFSDSDKKAEYLPSNNESPVKDVTDYLTQAREDIIISHRLPSPTLIGLPGGASLGGDGGTIDSASHEFFNNVILVSQKAIKDELIKIFGYCGFETDIIIEQNIKGMEQIV